MPAAALLDAVVPVLYLSKQTDTQVWSMVILYDYLVEPQGQPLVDTAEGTWARIGQAVPHTMLTTSKRSAIGVPP